MLTELQLTEIRNYLLSKKLPIDILIEVNDHFVSQISDLQREENLGFEEAFEKTKENWKEELSFSTIYSNNSDVALLKKIKQRQNLNFFILSLKIFFAILIISLIISNFSNVKIFTYYFSFIQIILFTLPIVIKIVNYNDFELSSKYKKIKLNSLQSISNVGAASIFYLLTFSKDILKRAEQIFYILNGNYKRILNINETNATLLCVLTFLIILMFTFFSIKLYFYIKKIKEVRPFLSDYLKN